MNVEVLRTRGLRAAAVCREKGISQSQIAIAVGASQPQISRILAGRGQRQSRLFEEVCLYVEKLDVGVSAEAVRANEDLIDALSAIWDGTALHARALACVIRSLAALKPMHLQVDVE